MSYGTKYYFERYDWKGRLTRVNLKLRDYTGSSLLLPKGGINFEFGSNRATTVIRGSSAKIGLWSYTQGQFSEFRAVTDRKWLVEVLKDSAAYWYGWITPEVFSEPFKQPVPYRIELTAMDGLGDLKNVPYQDQEGVKWTGRSSVQTIIDRCLSSTGFSLNTCFSALLRPLGTTGNMFQTAFYANAALVDSDNSPMNCADVLERFLPFGITVKQWRGKWYIVRSEDLILGVSSIYETGLSLYIESFNRVIDNPGDYGAQTIVVNKSGIVSQAQAVKEITISVDYGKKQSILNNYNFINKDDGWSVFPFVVEYSILGTQPYAYLEGMDVAFGNQGITQEILVAATSNSMTFSAKVAAYGWHRVTSSSVNASRQSLPINVQLRIKLTGTTTYYLDKVYGWQTTEAFIGATVDSYTGGDISFTEIKVTTGGFPVPGTLEVKLCKIQLVSIGTYDFIGGVAWTDVRVYGDDAKIYIDKSDLKEINNKDYNYTPSTIKALVCDAPIVDNAKLNYINHISDSADTPTNGWTDDKIGGLKTLQKLFIDHYIRNAMIPTRVLNVTLRGTPEWIGTLSHDGTFYELISASVDDRNCEWNVEARELLSLPPFVDKLAAFFFRIESGLVYDFITGLYATVSGSDITWPNITGSDVLDFSDIIFWNNSLQSWYNSSTPRKCPVGFMVGAEWAESATDVTHARLFHADYMGQPGDMIPVLIYNQNLTSIEQAQVIEWLNWYYVIAQGGVIISDSNDIITQ